MTSPTPESSFHIGGPSHWVVFGLILLVPLLLSLWARRFPSAQKPISRIFASVLLATLFLDGWIEYKIGHFSLETLFPFHVCDMAILLTVGCFWFNSFLCFEVLYFWGLTGTVQALLTPDLAYDFPHPKFITFFINHAGIISAIGYAVFGLKLLPTPQSRLRVFKISIGYTIFLMLFNHFVGTNYGYLSHKPASASALDLFGPWPWYILVMLTLFWVIFWINELPARWLRARREREKSKSEL